MTHPDDEGTKPHDPRPTAQRISGATPSSELADLQVLLGPRESRLYTPWGNAGHSDPTLLAGRPLSSYIHVIALCLAATADVGAFFQIVELVLPTYTEGLVFIVVLGFTATVLYLAHACGVLFRDHKAGAGWVNGTLPYLCALIWLGLGVAALAVRLQVLSISSSTFSLSVGSAQPSSVPSIRYGSAILFFALYVATGLVAGIGAYLTHNPLRNSYASATRAYRKAIARLAASTFQARTAEGQCRAYRAELRAADEVLQHEIQMRRALAAKLKHFTTMQVDPPPKTPAVTEAEPSED